MRDFSITKYERICSTLADSGYRSITLSDYFILGGIDLTEKRVLLRHDVDRLAFMSIPMAEVEADYGLTASYYFRMPSTFKPNIIEELVSLGHEVGFHYENLAKTNGNLESAIRSFSDDLNRFREFVEVRTITMHGNPASRYDNRDLWNSFNIKDFDLLGEAYIDMNFEQVMYYSDTGRTWEEGKFNVRDIIPEGKSTIPDKPDINTTDDLINLIKIEDRNLYLVMHPERWPSSFGGWLLSWIKDLVLNWGKIVFKTLYSLKS
jgi:hypothetical protein